MNNLRNISFTFLMMMVFINQTNVLAQKMFLPDECPERVELLSDRQVYISGESLWFSAVCYLNDSSENTTISQILYIEIFNASNRVFVQKKFKLNNGFITGKISIPEELPSAAYFIRAYTQLMRNYPPETYFHSVIQIFNPEFSPSVIPDDSIQVYTSHGCLYPAIENRIVMNVSSFSENTRISLVDSLGIFQSPLRQFDNGIATVTFKPSDTATYSIRIINTEADTSFIPLPRACDQPLGMMVSLTDKGLKITIAKQDTKLKLEVYSQTKTRISSFETENKNSGQSFETPSSMLPVGLIYVCAYNENDELIDLKTVYYQSDEMIHLPVSTNKKDYARREKVSFTIDTNSLLNEDLMLLQTSVVKKGATYSGASVPANLIYNPVLWKDAYLDVSDPQVLEQLEAALVIYSNGIRPEFEKRIKQKQVEMLFVPDIRDISITGVVVDSKTSQPIDNVRVYASVLHDVFQLHATTTQLGGRFIFSFPHLTGDQEIFLRAQTTDSITPEILLNNDFSTHFAEFVEKPITLNQTNMDFINGLLVDQQVTMVYNAKESAKPEVIPSIETWFGHRVETTLLSDYIALNSVREVFNEIVHYTRLRERNGHYQIVVFDEQSELSYEDPLILLDGIPIVDAGILLDMYPAQIEKIDVINRTFILGDFTIRGLVYIHTKTDNFGGLKLPEDVVFLNYQMRSEPASFISSDSLFVNTLPDNLPWFETLLEFNPSISKHLSGQTFYTSDQTGDYEINITGKTRSGKNIKAKQIIRIQ